MRSSNILIVYRKELLDMVRDRRTIISAILLPLLIFPLMVFGFGAAVAKSVTKVQKETSKIVVLGATNAPALIAKIKANPALEIQEGIGDYTDAISNKRIRAAVEIPPAFETNLGQGSNLVDVVIYTYTGEVRSQVAVRALQQVLRDYADEVVAARLNESDLSKDILKPLNIVETNVAAAEKVGGNILGGLIPYMIIILSFAGALAPAIDLTAGEKERGTIETILASPVSRVDLVIGKFLMVLTASIVTTVVSLGSFAATFTLPIMVIKQMGSSGPMPFQISLTALLGVLVLILPLAIMFSAGLMAIALFAKTYKEAQTYLSPLMMLVVMPAMVALLPGFELKPILTVIPIINVTLVSKELLSGTWQWMQLAGVFGSSCLYAAIALGLAVMMFKKESVLFRS